jgi:ATP-dependent helicase/nuclease subunit B
VGPFFQRSGAYNRSMDADFDSQTLFPKEIANALERGATVVTGNQRAARTLRHGFNRWNRALGRKSWRPARVMAWDAWLSSWWSRRVLAGQATQILLNRSQELAVWRAVLEADRELRSLRTPDSLAEMAAEAWRLLCSYNGQSRLHELSVSTDTRAFLRWGQAFARRCRAEGLLSSAGLEETLRTAVAAGEVDRAAGELVLVGFDALTSAQGALLKAMQAAGTSVEELATPVPAVERALVEAADEGEELYACARWVRRLVEGRAGATVGVIVPGLEARRAEIDRVFREVLAPELEAIGAGSGAGPYEFSVGVPLAATPMVTAALDSLRWAQGAALPLERVSALLLSPYFAGGRAGLGERAEFDAFELRRTKFLRPELSLEALSGLLDKTRVTGLARLAAALRRMVQARARWFAQDEALFHGEWAEAARELLEAAGWGAGASEDSLDFQTRAKWESVLDELATLDFDGTRVRFGAALDRVEKIARRTLFAPESREAPVQVMGPLEAAGSRFDAVWFVRAGELTWPMATTSSPLLPWQMQRELGMRGGDAAREMEFARRVTERIAESAESVVFSYAVESADGRQRASKAVETLELEEVKAADFVSADSANLGVELESVADDASIATLPAGVLQGGAKVLESQAACGFRAFAEHRLWSSELDRVELGLDAGESGTVVHGALESFWEQVRTQEALAAMTWAERAAVLEDAIGKGLAKTAQLSASSWDAAYLGMQRERLRRLLGPWLEEELARPAFAVQVLEERLPDVRVGPLRLSVRVDRVDQTAGGAVVIDYKTGRAATKDWLSDRPDAPQLPLYAVVAEAGRLGGVAFGVVRAGKEMSWKSFAGDESVMRRPAKMAAETFTAQVEDWREVLTNLAEQFAAGDARVAPKIFPQTCERCGQRLLCRVDAASQQEAEEDEAAEVSGG